MTIPHLYPLNRARGKEGKVPHRVWQRDATLIDEEKVQFHRENLESDLHEARQTGDGPSLNCRSALRGIRFWTRNLLAPGPRLPLAVGTTRYVSSEDASAIRLAPANLGPALRRLHQTPMRRVATRPESNADRTTRLVSPRPIGHLSTQPAESRARPATNQPAGRKFQVSFPFQRQENFNEAFSTQQGI